MERILELFAENEIRATFFFTGEIASFYPDLVKRVAAEGHEIASHNLIHKDYHQVALYEVGRPFRAIALRTPPSTRT